MNAAERTDEDLQQHTWAIVLAAGRGERLARITRALHGRDVPKQFAALGSSETLFQQAVARAVSLVPAERVVVVVAEPYLAVARDQLRAHPGARIVGQPRDVGTLPGLLLPLAHVLERDPRARVVVYPAGHDVQRLEPFNLTIRSALDAASQSAGRIVTVGERQSLIMTFEGAPFWAQALDAHPALAQPFTQYRASLGHAKHAEVCRAIYARLPTLDLERDLLQRANEVVAIEMADAGWTDCGTPEGLFARFREAPRLRSIYASLGFAC